MAAEAKGRTVQGAGPADPIPWVGQGVGQEAGADPLPPCPKMPLFSMTHHRNWLNKYDASSIIGTETAQEPSNEQANQGIREVGERHGRRRKTQARPSRQPRPARHPQRRGGPALSGTQEGGEGGTAGSAPTGTVGDHRPVGRAAVAKVLGHIFVRSWNRKHDRSSDSPKKTLPTLRELQ